MVDKIKQKEQAIKHLEQLDIYKPYVRAFKSKTQRVCFFEGFGGYYVDQEPKIYEKMKAIEAEYDCIVYAITHEHAEFGEMYSFLLVSKYEEDWEAELISNHNKTFYAFAYVWNIDADDCSEFGDVLVQSFGGGITRLG